MQSVVYRCALSLIRLADIMNVFKALAEGFRGYVCFRGRMTRASFWNFVITTHLLIFLLLLPAFVEFMKFYRFMLEDSRILDLLTARVNPASIDLEEYLVQIVQELGAEYLAAENHDFTWPIVGLVAACVMGVVVLLPTISATVRRLRDAGQSVWWVLAPLAALLPVPFVGVVAQLLTLVTLALCCMASKPELPDIP